MSGALVVVAVEDIDSAIRRVESRYFPSDTETCRLGPTTDADSVIPHKFPLIHSQILRSVRRCDSATTPRSMQRMATWESRQSASVFHSDAATTDSEKASVDYRSLKVVRLRI